MLKIIMDADMFAFRASITVETEINWQGDLWTMHSDLADAKATFDDTTQNIVDKILAHYKYEGAYEIIMCLSSASNFRKQVLPTYKLNRASKRKPLAYTALVDWIKDNYTCCQIEGLEADDCIGILATTPGTNAVIVSGDKDMRSIPGRYYDFIHDVYYDISEQEANYRHLWQTLVGDIADNYKGCPGIGEVSAKKLLDKDCSWQTVLDAFIKKGLPEYEALAQARVARILRYSDYDFKNNKPILWAPI